MCEQLRPIGFVQLDSPAANPLEPESRDDLPVVGRVTEPIELRSRPVGLVGRDVVQLQEERLLGRNPVQEPDGGIRQQVRVCLQLGLATAAPLPELPELPELEPPLLW